MKYIYEFRSPGLTQQLFLDYRKKLECPQRYRENKKAPIQRGPSWPLGPNSGHFCYKGTPVSTVPACYPSVHENK